MKKRDDKNEIILIAEAETAVFIKENGQINPYLYDATTPVFGDKDHVY